MTDVFISYSRKDAEFMRLLHGKLQEAQRDVWVDWEDIPATADWWNEIKSAIEAADAFAFIISSHSVRSEVCRDEIQHAIDNNKRFIPLLFHEISDEDAPFVHSAIRSHNWIPFNNSEKYDESVQKLLDALSTDPDYLRRHTRLLVRAKEWVQHQRHGSYLLKGAELGEYQRWLQDSQRLQPKPTELQLEYVLASQSARAKNQLRLAFGGIVAVIVFAIIIAVALLQNQQLRETAAQGTIVAQEQLATRQAQETQIAAQATNIAGIRNDSQSLITQAYIQNTQSALMTENASLRQTISVYELNPSPTPLILPSATVLAATETRDSEFEDEGTSTPAPTQDAAEAQGVPLATRVAVIPSPTANTTGGANPPDEPAFFVNPHGDDDNNCQSPESACRSVGAAIAKASEGDFIEVAPGVYNETLLIDKSLTIRGLDAENTLLNGDFAGRVLTINEGVTLHLVNVMITGGTAIYGGGILNEGELYMDSVVVMGNFADLTGGGLANFGYVEAIHSDFSENYAPSISDIYTANASETIFDGEVIQPVAASGEIAINSLVLINTTDGDNLNLREEANRRSRIVGQLPSGAIAAVFDGPREQDGLRWWLIFVPTGEYGWVVESSDGVQTIVPIE